MIKPICRDLKILSQKSIPATSEDLNIGQDLYDTLKANSERCVGMAANMIGELKRIIIVDDHGEYLVMYNPTILKFSGSRFETEEGCLSLDGVRPCTRYQSLKLEYYNEKFQKRIKNFEGWTAQIIQHEMDHLDGIII